MYPRQVTGFQTSDGRMFPIYKMAVEHQRKLDAERSAKYMTEAFESFHKLHQETNSESISERSK